MTPRQLAARRIALAAEEKRRAWLDLRLARKSDRPWEIRRAVQDHRDATRRLRHACHSLKHCEGP